MKCILEFDLPEDVAELDQALASAKYQSVIFEFIQWIRNETKYGTREAIPAEEVKSKIWELINDEEIGEHFL